MREIFYEKEESKFYGYRVHLYMRLHLPWQFGKNISITTITWMEATKIADVLWENLAEKEGWLNNNKLYEITIQEVPFYNLTNEDGERIKGRFTIGAKLKNPHDFSIAKIYYPEKRRGEEYK